MSLTTQNLLGRLDQFYDNLTLHIVPGPRSLGYFIPFLTLCGVLLSPEVLSEPARRHIAALSIVIIQVFVWYRDSSFDVISMNAVLSTFMLLGWYDIRNDFKRVKAIVGSASKVNDGENLAISYPHSLGHRVVWVLDLLSAIRFTFWQTPANRSRGLPTRPWKDSVGSFYWTTVVKAVWHYCLLDFTSSYISKSPSFVRDTLEKPLPWQVEMFIVLAHVYAALALYNAFLPIALSVVLAPFPGLINNDSISPLCWPAHFGPVSAVWTSGPRKCGLRAFWGIFWHQNMRYITSTPGNALAWLLGSKKGTTLRYLLIVTVSFFFSGIVHMGIVPPQPLRSEKSCWQLRTRLATFFWLQPIGIMLETIFFSLITDSVKLRSKRARCMITVWTASFLATSMWFSIRPVGKELGWWSVYLVPFSMLSLL